MNKRILLIAGVALLIAGAGYGLAQKKSPANLVPGAGAPAISVEAETVTPIKMAYTLEAVGDLLSNESITLSPEVAGRITAILFEEGQAVEAGTPLVAIDDAIARAELAQAEARLKLSQQNYDRAKQLFSKQSGTERARDEALAQLEADQATVALTKARLEKMTIKAPFGGIAGLRRVSAGEYINPGQAIAGFESIDPIKVDFRIPETHLGSLKTGQILDVTVDAFPGKIFKGTVYAIDPRLDSTGRAVLLRARLENHDGQLRPGMFARVSLTVAENQNALTVNEEALVPQASGAIVYRIEDGKAAPVPIKTGQRREGRVEIVEGLKAGDVIVTAGQMKLRPGMAVRILPAATGE